jgi:hypothetical protein
LQISEEEEIQNVDLHRSRSIVGIMKSRRQRWARHVAGMGKSTAFSWRNVSENVHVEDQEN